MRGIWRNAKQGLAGLWRGLREWCGDAAYENYKKCATRSGEEHVLPAAKFYVEQLNRKYSKPNRCC